MQNNLSHHFWIVIFIVIYHLDHWKFCVGYVCKHMRARVCVCICMCAYVYIYTHINICTFMHNKMFILMIFLPILRTQHIYRNELQYVYMGPLKFLRALTEDTVSDHRSCQGVQGIQHRRTTAHACSEGWSHICTGSNCGGGSLGIQCPPMLGNGLCSLGDIFCSAESH